MKVLLIHGFEGSNESHWFPWLETALTAQGHEVLNLNFPNAAHPDLEEILEFYTPHMDSVDVVLGHSLGPFIGLKLAESYSLKKLILVAPVLGELDWDHFREIWPESDVDSLEACVSNAVNFDALHVDEKIAFFSGDDPYIPVAHMHLLDDSWQKIVLEGRAHFNQKNFPELLERF